MIKKTPLILCVLSLSYFTWWVSGISHLEQIEDDQYVGKILLIYPFAGKFMLEEQRYIGKQSGDSYFYYSSSYPSNDESQMLYRIVAKYQEYFHGFRRLFGKYGITQYLIEPVDGETKKRLFFSVETFRACDPYTNLIDTDPDTWIKIDFVCD